MDKYNFVKLLRKYLKGIATAEEQDFLISYYNLFQNEPDVIALLSAENKTALKEEIRNTILQNIAQGNQAVKKVKSVKLWPGRLAAASVLIALSAIGILLSNYYSKTERAKTVTVQNNQHAERLIHLPDGSTVILGVGSEIHFSSSFTHLSKREIYLEGNAFFDVVHNAAHPFVVHSEKLETTVLGTAFSVEAYPWYKDITVTVKRGRVKVADQYKTQGVITPNQQIKYNKIKATSIQQLVDADSYTSWKGTNLIFDDVTVAEAAEVLEKKFKIKILFSDQLVKNKRFTATIKTDESLGSILKSICEFNKAVFSYDKTKTIVLIKSKTFQLPNKI